jgi:hypothetical protein
MYVKKFIMPETAWAESTKTLYRRALPDGGFVERQGSSYRVDATAWATLALTDHADVDMIRHARSRLEKSQGQDGRVSVSADHPEAFWPTPLAILAWHGSMRHREPQERATRFLLQTSGLHFEKNPDSPLSNDTSLLGWPWTEDTFAWVQPTALSLLALKISGNGAHPRAKEAIRLLLDRQLPGGGWNYGNTIVYGQELYPQIECTGMALTALSGETERKTIEKSLAYLKVHADRCRTPLSLGWLLLGLSAWKERPRNARERILESLNQQQKYGVYGTTLLSLLYLVYRIEGNLIDFMATRT